MESFDNKYPRHTVIDRICAFIIGLHFKFHLISRKNTIAILIIRRIFPQLGCDGDLVAQFDIAIDSGRPQLQILVPHVQPVIVLRCDPIFFDCDDHIDFRVILPAVRHICKADCHVPGIIGILCERDIVSQLLFDVVVIIIQSPAVCDARQLLFGTGSVLLCAGVKILMSRLGANIHNAAGQDPVGAALRPYIYLIDILRDIKCKCFCPFSSFLIGVLHHDSALTAVFGAQLPAVFTCFFDADDILSLYILHMDICDSKLHTVSPGVLLVLHIAALSAVDPLVPSRQKGACTEIPMLFHEALFDVKSHLRRAVFFAFADDGHAHFYAPDPLMPERIAVQHDFVTV